MSNIIEKDKSATDLLVAHRGFSSDFPENTIIAIKAAVEEGAKYIEIDIQLTKDKKAILFHDRDLTRLCEESGAIHDYNWNELKSFSSFSPDLFLDKYKGQSIATLDEIVNYLRDYPDVTLFVELKRISISSFGIDTVLDSVLPLLNPIKNQCVIISFSLDIIESIRQTTDFPVAVVIDNWEEAIGTEFNRIKAIKPEFFFTDIDFLPEYGNISLLDSKIVVYECVDDEQAYNVLNRGVHLVETFNIREMKEKLNEKINHEI